MARRQTAARRYAEAAYELGSSDRSLDAWEKDLARLGELLRVPELRRLLEHPAVPYADKEKVLRRVAGDVGAEPMDLILLMVRRGRPKAIEPMLERFTELLRRHRGVALAEVRTALALDDDQRRAIADRLQELTEQRIEINELVDEGLIGGVSVRIGDQLYDASVRSRLERLRTRLTAAS